MITDQSQIGPKLKGFAKPGCWSEIAEKHYGKYQISVVCARQADLCLFLNLNPQSVVLVIGDKFGSMSFRLTSTAAQVCVAENDPEALRLLRVQKDQERLDHLEVIETDFSALPFPDRFFDGIIVNRPGKVQGKLVSEIARVLKTEGQLLMTGVSARGRPCRNYKNQGLGVRRKYLLLPSAEEPLYVVERENSEAFPLLIQAAASQARRASLFETWLFKFKILAVKLVFLFRLQAVLDFLPLFGLILSRADLGRGFNRIEKIVQGIPHNKQISRPAYLFHTGLGQSTLLVKLRKRSAPEFVLKIAREKSEGMRRELEILTYLHKVAPSHFLETIPKPIPLPSSDDRDVFCMTYLPGKPKDLRLSDRREVEAYFRAVRLWLTHLDAIPVPQLKEPSSRFQEARACILKMTRKMPGIAGSFQQALGFIEKNRIRDIASELRLVINHRDLIPGHILFERRRMKVIDWGNSHYGYPLLDWVRFVLKTHAWIFRGKKMAAVVRNLFFDPSYLAALFCSETKSYCRDIRLNSEWVLPLFLLSVFDYLEGYFYFSNDDWCPDFEFLFKDFSWWERTGLV